MESTPEVSIIIPAYNEEKAINDVISNLKSLPEDYEIIVVDDGSSDKTAEIVKQYTHLQLIKHENNKGYGAALKTGIGHSRGDVIVITDSDGTYPIEKIPEFARIIIDEKLDMVVGSRVGDHVRIPLVRKPAKWFINKLANYLTATAIPDVNSGFRIFKKATVEKFIRILPDGFSFTTTITLAMLTNGLLVKYVPINYYKRAGKSKIRPIKDTLNFIQLIIRTVMYFNPLKVFIPFSLFIVLLAFIILGGSWLFIGKAMDVTFGVLLMTAVIIMAIGMLADLIDKRVI